MIRSKQELKFYLLADYIMNRGEPSCSILRKIYKLLFPDTIINYLVAMRKYDYYRSRGGVFSAISKFYYYSVYRRLGVRLGFSIGCDSIGYGVVIPHYGTIVVGESNRIGNFAVLNTSICISSKKSVIGDYFYCGTGAKITQKMELNDNVTISANSVINKCPDSKEDILLVGSPGYVKCHYHSWANEEPYNTRRNKVLEIKRIMKF